MYTASGIPYVFSQLEFSINKYYEIELLHLFMLKAILKGADVNDISEAINFSENEVSEELYKMCESGYIETDYRTLTKFSYAYLEVFDFVTMINQRHYPVYRNLIDGTLRAHIDKSNDVSINKQKPAIDSKMFAWFNKISDGDYMFFTKNIHEFQGKQPEFLKKARLMISWRCLNNGRNSYSMSDLVYES